MSYAGDITPAQAWDKVNDGAALVDVRTVAEWEQIGRPVTAEGIDAPVFIEWLQAGGVQNAGFVSELQAQVPLDREVVFLCRSGQRSIGAAQAATAAGYTAFNILEGFEGVPGPDGQRTVNGWKNSGLPTDIASSAGAEGIGTEGQASGAGA